jgi:DNA-binding CsgD family transcriptional regulator
MFVGRERELARLGILLDSALAGRTIAAMVIGDPGVGKTTLVREFALAGTAKGCAVVSALGDEAASTPFGTLARLLSGHDDIEAIIGAEGASVLRRAAGIDASPTSLPAHQVGGWLARWLAALAGDRGLMMIADDAPWFDPATADALRMASRLLLAEPVLLLFVRRTDDPTAFDHDHLPRLVVEGLPERDVAALIGERGCAAPASVVRTLWQGTGGNPLAISELTDVLHGDQLSGLAALPDPLPVGGDLRALLMAHVERLNPTARTSARLVAAAGWCEVEWLEAAERRADLVPGAWRDAEAGGVVTFDGAGLSMTHPLLRSAALGVPPAEVRTLHAHLAAALAGEGPATIERRARHLSAAVDRPDAAVAAAVEASAVQARTCGAPVDAAHRFERAASLHPDPVDRARLLAGAAEALRYAGRPEPARRMIDAADVIAAELPTDAVVDLRGRIALTRSELVAWDDGPRAARQVLTALEADLAQMDPSLAAMVLIQTAASDLVSFDIEGALHLSARALEHANRGDGSALLPTMIVEGYAKLCHGARDEAEAVITAPLAIRDALLDLGTDEFDLSFHAISLLLIFSEDFDAARDFAERAMRVAARNGSAAAEAGLTSALVETGWRTGRWTEHRSLLTSWFANDVALPVPHAILLAQRARIAIASGDLDIGIPMAEEAIERGRRLDVASAVMWGEHALGLGALSVDDPVRAAQHFSHVVTATRSRGVRDPGLLWWTADAFDAFAGADRLADATELLAHQVAVLGSTRRLYVQGSVGRGEALLAPDPVAADEAFAASGDAFERLGAPFELARTMLAWGRRRRADGRADESAEPLSRAAALFTQLGATRFGALANGDARTDAAAVSPTPALDRLTASERRVVLSVARGASNREVADDLFISVKTIEYHLQNAYRKLGIHSRVQLAAIVLGTDAG